MKSRLLSKVVGRCLRTRQRNLLAVSFALVTFSIAALVADGQVPVRDYRRAHERQILEEFTRLLAIPNVASDRENIRKNAQFILEMMQRRGLNPQLLEAKSKSRRPQFTGNGKCRAQLTRSFFTRITMASRLIR